MCNICMATSTFATERHAPGSSGFEASGNFDGPINAVITEISDAAESAATIYTMSVGDAFRGTISSSLDEDWVAVNLTAGQTYVVSHTGGTLSDPLLTIRSSSGTIVASNDDISFPANLNSQITFTASYSGTYYLEADAFSTNTGSYTLRLEQGIAPPVATYDELADYLLEGEAGYRQFFDTSSSNQITVDISGLTAAGRQLALWAMEAWEAVADIDFVVQYDGAGNEMILVDDEDSGAFAFLPNSTTARNDTDGAELNVSTQWLSTYGTTLDSYSFQTYVHEFGHALGLRHQGNYNGNATYGTDNTFANDSWQVSVMSYFSQTENTTTNASYALLAGPMMADILAIQELYGAPGANGATAGDTVFGLNSNLGNYLDDFFTGLATRPITSNGAMAYTLYDQGGTDLIDLSFLNSVTAADLDMNGGEFSNIGSLIGVLGVARGTVIENASLGAGNDTVTGNAADNVIDLGAGNDRVSSGAGADTIYAGNGGDIINTGAGDDFIFGGTDTRDLRDVVDSGDGNDSIDTGYGNDYVLAGAGDDTIVGGFGVDELIGQGGDDVITGAAFSDRILGGVGRDFINGGFGHDRLNGGDDGDFFYHLGIFDHGSDWIQDYDHEEGDVLQYGNSSASVSDFQVNYAETESAGVAGVQEAFVIYRPTGQILWALVDGGGQDDINILIGGGIFDLA